MKDAQRQALKQFWKRQTTNWWTSSELFFNANAANALAAKKFLERDGSGATPRYRITDAGRAEGDRLFSSRPTLEED